MIGIIMITIYNNYIVIDNYPPYINGTRIIENLKTIFSKKVWRLMYI